MKYLFLAYGDEKRLAAMPASERHALGSECRANDELLRRRGHLLAVQGLQDSRTATTVRLQNGKVVVTDGPYAETKEQILGIFTIDARDLNQAIQVASNMPQARGGPIEVRPIVELDYGKPRSRLCWQMIKLASNRLEADQQSAWGLLHDLEMSGKEQDRMNTQQSRLPDAQSGSDKEISALYRQLLGAWNKRNAAEFAALFAEDGNVVGFDGSQVDGRAEIEAHLGRIFADHPTAAYVGKAREVRFLAADVAILRAVSGMVPPGEADLNPAVNTIQSLVAVKREGQWRIALYQNTPAQFHGRPDLARQLTEELRQLL